MAARSAKEVRGSWSVVGIMSGEASGRVCWGLRHLERWYGQCPVAATLIAGKTKNRPPRWSVAVGTTSNVPSVVERANLEVAYQVRQLLYSPPVGDL